MEWLWGFLEKHIVKFMAVPPALASFLFIVTKAMQDGVIDDAELHSIIQAGLGLDVLFLIPVLLYIHFKRKGK